MATLEERVSYLEGRVEDHSRTLSDLRELIVALDQKVDRRFESLEERLERRFTWVIGIQLSTLLTIVVGLLGIIGALVRP